MTPRLDRLIPLLTLILAGLGLVFLLDAAAAAAVFNLGGDLPRIPVAWPLVALLGGLAGAGVEWLMRSHPRWSPRLTVPLRIGGRTVEGLWPWWILPALTPPAVFAFCRLFRGSFGIATYVGVLIGTGGLLALIYVWQHRLLLAPPEARGGAAVGLHVVAFALAFAIFAAVTYNRYRTLYAAVLLVPSITLLGYDLLRGAVATPWRIAAALGLVLLEGYWLLGYWPAPFLLNAAALLLVFYAAIGILRNSPREGMPRAVLIEYGTLTVGGLVALAIAALVLRGRIG